MNQSGIVNNIKRLSTFIEDAYLKSDEDRYFYLQSDFNLFQTQLKAVYKHWFPKAKPIKDEEIVNQIFRIVIDDKNAKTWIKHSLACLINSSDRVFNNAKLAYSKQNYQIFLCELGLLREMAFEATMLMEAGFEVIENKEVKFGHWKRQFIHPRETFNASVQILRKYVASRTLGDFVLGPSSIFLIRQAIELWLQSIFFINKVTDLKGNLIKLQPERLFDLMDNSGKLVSTPVPKAVIQKIHQWTQTFVHAGWIAYSWETEHAHHVLSQLFNDSKVKIDKAHLDSIDDQLKKLLKREDIIVHRRTQGPTVQYL